MARAATVHSPAASAPVGVGAAAHAIINEEIDGVLAWAARGAKRLLSQNGYTITPSRPGQFQTWKQLVEPAQRSLQNDAAFGDLGIKEDSTANLVRDFVECTRSRRAPLCSLEDGHRSTSFAHLANIALATGSRIEWDAQAERITNNEAANELLHYEYRSPWKLE